jgi:small subunit ribosomal protein S16
MPTKIRLQRRGKKHMPFYHIVIADGRAPRDGRFIEKIGTYNPLTSPADIIIDIDKALDWLVKGAQPTNTVRAILSYKGILYKYHLQKGVGKGALTQQQADNRFAEWLAAKEAKIQSRIKESELTRKEKNKHRMEAEAKIKEAREKAIAKKRAAEMEARAEATAEATEEAATVEPATEAIAPAPQAVEEPVTATNEQTTTTETTAEEENTEPVAEETETETDKGNSEEEKQKEDIGSE